MHLFDLQIFIQADHCFPHTGRSAQEYHCADVAVTEYRGCAGRGPGALSVRKPFGFDRIRRCLRSEKSSEVIPSLLCQCKFNFFRLLHNLPVGNIGQGIALFLYSG